MLADHVVTKPPSMKGYAVHRLVAGMANGARAQFVDMGDHVLIRSDAPLTDRRTAVRLPAEGEILGFELRASVGYKTRSRHRYYPLANWRARHDWLRRQGERHGFEVRHLHCRARMVEIDRGDGRGFLIDQTDFTGVLRVSDAPLFHTALAVGVGPKAKAFGYGMLLI